MDEHGVTISFKEIYEEQQKTSMQINGVVSRLDSLERKIEKQEERQMNFQNSLKLQSITVIAPVVFAVLWFVAKGGGL